MDFLLLSLGLTGQWLLGWALAGWLLIGLRRRGAVEDNSVPLAERAGLGFVLGIGFTAWILFLWSACGGLLGSGASWILCAIGWICGAPSVIGNCLRHRRLLGSTRILSPAADSEIAFRRMCQLVAAALFASALVQTLLTPQRFWDERAIFAVKAAVLFEDHTVHSSDLAEKCFVQGHPRYPLLIPLAEQHVDALIGRVDDRLSKLVFPMLYIGLTLITAGVLSRRTTRSCAWLAAMLLATIPALMPDDYGFLCGQADAPVGCFHGVAVLYLWDALDRRGSSICNRRRWVGSMAVAGICGGFAAFTKDEGIAFLMVDCGALGFLGIASLLQIPRYRGKWAVESVDSPSSWHTSYRLLIVTTVFAGVAITLLAPWFLHRRALPLAGEMNYFGRTSLTLLWDRLSTLAWTIPHLASRMFLESSEWGLQWWLMAAALALAPRRACRPAQLLLLLDVLGSLAALVVAGMLAPVRLEEHIGGSSHRFLMQIAPVAIVFAAGQFMPRRPDPNPT